MVSFVIRTNQGYHMGTHAEEFTANENLPRSLTYGPSVVVESPLVIKPVRSTILLSEDVINYTLPEFLQGSILDSDGCGTP